MESRMMFYSQLRNARLTYAIIMAILMGFFMSAVATTILQPIENFWQHWPKVLMIDWLVAVPLAIVPGPVVRLICRKLYSDLPN